MSNVNVLLDAASVQIIDLATNTYRVNTGIGTVTLTASNALYGEYTTVPVSPGIPLSLPDTTVWVVYIKNLSATANITVQIQAAGGTLASAANSPILVPGAVYIYWSPSESAGGITGVTLISSSGNAPVEVLVAA